MTDAQVEAAANAILNEIGMANGAPLLRNPLDMLKAESRDLLLRQARAALVAAQAGAPDIKTILAEADANYDEGFAAGIEAACGEVSSYWLRERIRALRPPTAPAESERSCCRSSEQSAGCVIPEGTRVANESAAPTPLSASEPAGALQKAKLLPLPDRLRGLASRHAAVEWPELQSALIEAAKALEPTEAEGRGACSKCGATWYTPGVNLPCPVCTSPEPAGAQSEEDVARMVEQMIDETPWKDQMWARAALTIAARAIRRGRHLNDREKLENLARSFEEHPGDTDEEREASIRAAKWLRGQRGLRP